MTQMQLHEQSGFRSSYLNQLNFFSGMSIKGTEIHDMCLYKVSQNLQVFEYFPVVAPCRSGTSQGHLYVTLFRIAHMRIWHHGVRRGR